MKQSPHSQMDEEQVDYKDHVETLRQMVQQKENDKFTEFYEFIKHGDEAHQAWIKGAIEGFFKVKISR